jgi:hypothetical protein
MDTFQLPTQLPSLFYPGLVQLSMGLPLHNLVGIVHGLAVAD